MQPATQPNEENEEDDELDLKLISSFADKVQHSGESRVQITIPKRGEKDFEPLAETVKLQEMMLQRSREALFGALQGVRGGAGKSVSHALLTPHSPYPTMLVTRGHLLDTMGITVRQAPSDAKGKGKASIQLLPEEALFLLERGSLQIWMGEGEWDDEIWGVPGAVEMSVAEAFSTFLGKDGLSWERYQAYAVLKRLGYTVQRTRRFIPAHFLAQDLVPETFRSWWLSIPGWLSSFARSVYARVTTVPRFSIWNWLRSWRTGPLLLSDWRGTNFASLFAHLRIIPTGHTVPLKPRAPEVNPYLPFYHVWKPAYPWAKNRWDKGSAAGLAEQPPSYHIAAVDSRTVRMPTIHQLTEVWDELPHEPKGPVQRSGPQYKQLGDRPYRPNPMGELRNGDRAFIVAVNDSGNTGWLRFGRSGFGEHVMI